MQNRGLGFWGWEYDKMKLRVWRGTDPQQRRADAKRAGTVGTRETLTVRHGTARRNLRRYISGPRKGCCALDGRCTEKKSVKRGQMLTMSARRGGLDAAFRASAAVAKRALKPSKASVTALARPRKFSSSSECEVSPHSFAQEYVRRTPARLEIHAVQ